MGDTRLLCIFAAMLFPPSATRGGTVFASISILGLLFIGHKIIHVRSPTAHQAFYKALCLRSPFCLYNVSEESMMSSIFQGKNRDLERWVTYSGSQLVGCRTQTYSPIDFRRRPQRYGCPYANLPLVYFQVP